MNLDKDNKSFKNNKENFYCNKKYRNKQKEFIN